MSEFRTRFADEDGHGSLFFEHWSGERWNVLHQTVTWAPLAKMESDERREIKNALKAAMLDWIAAKLAHATTSTAGSAD